MEIEKIILFKLSIPRKCTKSLQIVVLLLMFCLKSLGLSRIWWHVICLVGMNKEDMKVWADLRNLDITGEFPIPPVH